MLAFTFYPLAIHDSSSTGACSRKTLPARGATSLPKLVHQSQTRCRRTCLCSRSRNQASFILRCTNSEERGESQRADSSETGALPPSTRKLPPDIVEEQITEQRVRFAEPVGSEKIAIAFTCARCETRVRKRFSRHAYLNGIVIISCPGCQVRHLIADNIGWFKDIPRSAGRAGYHIDDFAKVERVSMEVFELEESFYSTKAELGKGELESSDDPH
ncbi:hypothetical protein F1559_004464 [Cyanidiococcus yangmingshanensis]|uniref:DNL-type domain-containing protein n=1 Tax=Cyanidiococcus yangmingshanensis TaxID=2690220 RepID=A0A7J7IKN0_9RHOD|nr:hypothetical protein F1559_004464 [Cyanidiococcus yangmingshanensis]